MIFIFVQLTLDCSWSNFRLYTGCITQRYPQSSPQCERCKNSAGTVAHQFWQCSKIQPFWCSNFRWYSCVLKVNLVPDPEIVLFGISGTLDTMAQKLRTVISCGMIIAKQYILTMWKSDTPPKFEAWLREFVGILHIEKLR